MRKPLHAALAHLVSMSVAPRDKRLREMAGGAEKPTVDEESDSALEAELEKHLGEDAGEGDKMLQVQPGSVEAEKGKEAATANLEPSSPEGVHAAAEHHEMPDKKKAMRALRFGK